MVLKRIMQSAALVYRGPANELQVLMVTSRMRRRWVLPKGMVEPGLTRFDSAAREAWEEAGVTGRISTSCLGVYRYVKRRRRGLQHCEVWVYPMLATGLLPHWPEQRQRRRVWMPMATAVGRVDEPGLRKLLALFDARYHGRTGASAGLVPETAVATPDKRQGRAVAARARPLSRRAGA